MQQEQLENFMTLDVKDFDRYYQDESQKGVALFRRLMMGPMDARVNISFQGQLRECIMLGSNNYLGFANDPYIKEQIIQAINKYGMGVSGPPLLNGHTYLHQELEKRLAKLKNTEDALLFPSGYQANLGIVETCMSAGDILIYDEMSHASFLDGIKMTRSSRKIKAYRFEHNNLDDLEFRLSQAAAKKSAHKIYVAVEGVYSMDGDICPLNQVAQLCKNYNAHLIIDDAHGTGVLGAHGGGTCEYFGLDSNFLYIMGTFSKAFSMTGGFVCGSREYINYMRYFSRAYMFSAHLPITTIAAIHAGLDLIEREPQRRVRCLANAQKLVGGLNLAGFNVKSSSPIVPLLVPENISIRQLNKRLFEEGLFVNAVEYPAVPLSTQRLRLSVSSAHSEEDINKSIDTLTRIGAEFGLVYLQ